MTRRLIGALLLVSSPCSAQLLDQTVAIVEDDIITQQELEQRAKIISQQIRQSGTPLPPAKELLTQVLDYMVINRLQMRRAAQIGFELDPKELEQGMQEVASRNQMTLQAFQAQIESSGVHFSSFRQYLLEELLTKNLQHAEARRLVQVTPEEVDRLVELRPELLTSGRRYHLRHILVAVSGDAGADAIAQAQTHTEQLRRQVQAGEDFARLALTESDGRNALKGGDMGWRNRAELPEVAAETIPTMEAGQVTAVLKSLSGFHLFYLQGVEDSERVMVNETRSRHILIQTNAMIDDAEARARLEAVRARIEGGERFEDLARAHSSDMPTAIEGGDLGFRSPHELDQVFQEQIDKLQPGQMSRPFRTRFGWHLAEVVERREVDDTQQTLRARAANYIAKRRVNAEIEVWLRRLRQESFVEYLINWQDV